MFILLCKTRQNIKELQIAQSKLSMKIQMLQKFAKYSYQVMLTYVINYVLTLHIKISTSSNRQIQAIIRRAQVVPRVVSEGSKTQRVSILYCLPIFKPCDCGLRFSRGIAKECYCIGLIDGLVGWRGVQTHWNQNKINKSL